MKTISISLLILFLALTSSAQSGGTLAMPWSTINGGGGTSTGGVFAVSGTIGQPDAAANASSGGPFTLVGGFWSLPPVSSGPPPALSARIGTAHTVILSWLNPSTGYVLQQTVKLNAPGGGWTDVTQTPVIVGPNKEVTLPANGQFGLFRLRHP
jgi:hypothetical protein